MLDIRTVSALEKVFPDTTPQTLPQGFVLTALRGETVSFQAAYRHGGSSIGYALAHIEAARPEHVTMREVVSVPCRYPAHPDRQDAGYLRTAPGLYPDLLRPLEGGVARLVAGQWRSLWIDYIIGDDHPAGDVEIAVRLVDEATGAPLGKARARLRVLDAALPPQALIRTEWFHADCLANYYGVPVFSPRHWEIMENFIAAAARRGCNMILTPQFTPPLDTAPGGERTTVQLVDVFVEDGAYRFDFSRLGRWVEMCRVCGMRYFEMSHLFTQWGARHAPKVMATVDGAYMQLFGWETDAVGGDYTDFLRAYLPQLTRQLRAWGIAEDTFFHISDEPSLEQLDAYRAAKESIAGCLTGFSVMDAISNLEVCQQGGIDVPVCAVDHIAPFLEAGTPRLWAYYCTGQAVGTTNRFFALPMARTRILGTQLFKFEIEGFLQWGYNFYNTHLSRQAIDPFFVTDSGEAFPGGDPFLVYPAPDGTPWESLRMMAMDQAMGDLRALQALAERRGRAFVLALIDEGLAEPIAFDRFPGDAGYLLNLRNRVNEALAEMD